jgi:surfeit locus 1 family protein
MSGKPRSLLLPTLAALVFLGITLAAGNWQLNRAQYKRELQVRIDRLAQEAPLVLSGGPVDAERMHGRRVLVTGGFDAAHEIFIDNRTAQGRPAYQVLTPLRIAGSDTAVLIDRGRVQHTWEAKSLPVVPTLSASVRIEGVAAPPSGKYLELSRQTVDGKVWQNLDMERYARTVPYTLLPVVVTQLNDTGDGLYRHWVRPDAGVEKHLGYAFQWFAMAVTIVVIYVVLYAKRRKQIKQE